MNPRDRSVMRHNFFSNGSASPMPHREDTLSISSAGPAFATEWDVFARSRSIDVHVLMQAGSPPLFKCMTLDLPLKPLWIFVLATGSGPFHHAAPPEFMNMT
jgi:hypothetical protein